MSNLSWANLQKRATTETPLTPQMLENGVNGLTDINENEIVKIGDYVAPIEDIEVIYKDRPTTIFTVDGKYKVLSFSKLPGSSYIWMKVTAENGLTWAISFDETYGGGADKFVKLVESKEEQEENYMLSKENIHYVSSLFKALYGNGEKGFGGDYRPVEMNDLISKATVKVFQNLDRMPQRGDSKEIENNIKYFIQVFLYKHFAESDENFVRLTETGAQYASQLGFI